MMDFTMWQLDFRFTLAFLPPGYDSKTFGKYRLPMFYGSDQKSNHQSYLTSVKRELVALPPEKSEPILTSFENIDDLLARVCTTREVCKPRIICFQTVTHNGAPLWIGSSVVYD